MISSGVSGPFLPRIDAGTPIFPSEWKRRVAKIALFLRPEANALAQRKGVRGHAALVVFAVMVAGLDRGGESRNRREIGVVELPVQTDASDGGGAEA